MKHIIILGDGMADHAVERLGGKTLLQYADTPYMDMLARRGRTGRLMTIPDGFLPGSEVANSTILGYDQNKVYEGRGPLEAASIGYRMAPEDLALRCNIIHVADGRIVTHNGGNLTTDNARPLIDALNKALGNDRVQFITGIQYRHLLIVKYASKHIECAPPHDYPNHEWEPLLVKPEKGWEDKREPVIGFDGKPTGEERMTAQETADLLNDLIRRSQTVLEQHPYNRARAEKGERTANLIWPWGGGYRPSMKTLSEKYPQIKSGSCIIRRRPHQRHRTICRPRRHQGAPCYRTGRHELRGQGTSRTDRPLQPGLRVRALRSQRRGRPRRQPGVEAQDHRIPRPSRRRTYI